MVFLDTVYPTYSGDTNGVYPWSLYIIRLLNRALGTPMGVTHGLSQIRLPNLVGTPMGATHGHYVISLPDI